MLDLPPDLIPMLEAQQRHRAVHGHARAPIMRDWKDKKVRIVGGELYIGADESYQNFLDEYLYSQMGDAWWREQDAKASSEKHPTALWYEIAVSARPAIPGALWLLRRLAYDAYLVRDNSSLKEVLIARLKRGREFQGARFELAVAAIMVAAGFKLQYYDESRRGQRWPEFRAVCEFTGQVLDVEAKSKPRAGLFAEPGSRVVPPKTGVSSLIADAAAKRPANPYLIFCEVNVPDPSITSNQGLQAAIERQQALLESQPQYKSGFPSLGVVYYNEVAPWHLQATSEENSVYWSQLIRAKRPLRSVSEALLTRVMGGLEARLNIPA